MRTDSVSPKRSPRLPARGPAIVTLCVLSSLVLLAANVSAKELGDPTRVENASTADLLVGTWEFQVTFMNCDTGEPLGPPFSSIHTYIPGGSALEQGSRVGPPPAVSRTVGQGVWERAGRRQFHAAFVFFVFGADGTFLSRVEIDETDKVSGRNQVFGYGVGRVFNPAGVQVGTNCFESPGQRLVLD